MFRFLQNSDVKVILTVTATGVETVQAETTNYTLVGEGLDAGGTVTMLVAPPTGTTLTIKRDVPLTQGTDYVENDPFPAESHETALDKLTMITQQIQEELDRSLKLTESNPATDVTVAAAQENSILQWDAAGNLKTVTLQQLGTVSVEGNDKRYGPLFTSVSAMKASVPVSVDAVAVVLTAGMTVRTQGYTTAGDGGGAEYLIVASQAADGFGDHVLANSNVSVLQNSNEFSVRQYGAKANGAGGVDDILSIQACYDAAEAAGFLYRADIPTRNFSTEFVDSRVVYWPGGDYGIGSELIVPYGVKTTCDPTTIIRALTNGQRMIRSIERVESVAAGHKGFHWHGGLIAGDTKARRGLSLDTTLHGADIITGLKVSGCSFVNGNFTTSGTAAIDAVAISVTDATNLIYGDVLYHAATGQFFIVESKAGNVLTIPKLAVAIGDAETLVHVSVGFQLQSGAELEIRGIDVSRCTLGGYLGSNDQGRTLTDMTMMHPWFAWNDFTVCFNNAQNCQVFGGKFQGATFGSDLTLIDVHSTTFHSINIEPSRFTDDTDIGGSAGNKTAMESIPVIRSLSGVGVVFEELGYAPNSTAVGFRRPIFNSADDLKLIRMGLGGSDLIVDPGFPGVFAYVEQSTSEGSVTVFDATHTNGLYDDPHTFITDGAGGLPGQERYYVWLSKLKTAQEPGGLGPVNTGVEQYVAATVSDDMITVETTGDSFPRLKITGNGRLNFGPGTSATDAVIQWRAAAAVGAAAGDSLFTDGEWDSGPLRLGNYRLWVDATGDLRIKSTAPTSDTDGVVVGTQT